MSVACSRMQEPVHTTCEARYIDLPNAVHSSRAFSCSRLSHTILSSLADRPTESDSSPKFRLMYVPSAAWWGSLLVALCCPTYVLAQGSYGGDQTPFCSADQAWVYKGCYDDDGNGRHANFNWQLSSSSNSERFYPGFNGPVTVDICLQACRGHGFRYAALYYGTECYCASIFPNPNPPSTSNGQGTLAGTQPGTAVSGSVCSSGCNGDSSQTCGAGSAASVYQDNTFTNNTAVRSASNYRYLGCFNNVNPGPMYTSIRTTSTISCQSYCGSLGYPYSARSGIDSDTGATSCGCGTEIQSGLQIDESNCNTNCDGSTGAS